MVIHLDEELEQKFVKLSRQKRLTLDAYTREVLLEHLQDLEDVKRAEEILSKGGRVYSSEEVKRRVGL
jgi:predicted DNA-binding protein